MFTLPSLPYAFDALMPSIDPMTMETHYSKHHQGYTNKLNALVADTEYADRPIEQLFSKMQELPLSLRIGIGNNGGGYYNHCLFWQCMTPGGSSMPEAFVSVLNESFGSVDAFKELFSDVALSQFGSGWAWLVRMEDGSLQVCGTANQFNPLMDGYADKGEPLLCLDVWEHAYYLHYQNKRNDYIATRWDVVNWDFVVERYNTIS